MTERKQFLINVAIQFGGLAAMIIGGMLIGLAGGYLIKNVLHLSPLISTESPPPISIGPLVNKIILLVIFLILLIFSVLRGNKYRKDVFNDITSLNLRNFFLYSFLQGTLLFLVSGFAYYTLVSTLTGA